MQSHSSTNNALVHLSFSIDYFFIFVIFENFLDVKWNLMFILIFVYFIISDLEQSSICYQLLTALILKTVHAFWKHIVENDFHLLIYHCKISILTCSKWNSSSFFLNSSVFQAALFFVVSTTNLVVTQIELSFTFFSHSGSMSSLLPSTVNFIFRNLLHYPLCLYSQHPCSDPFYVFPTRL